ncbi:unnamed protein product [Ectocarpus sp. 12 AP-2014]
MRPLCVLLLGGTFHPRVSSFLPPPAPISSSVVLNPRQHPWRREARCAPSPRRTSRRARHRSSGSSSGTAAGSWCTAQGDDTRRRSTPPPAAFGRAVASFPRLRRAERTPASQVQHAPPPQQSACSAAVSGIIIQGTGSSSSRRRRTSSSSSSSSSSIGATATSVGSSSSISNTVVGGTVAEKAETSRPYEDPTAAAHGFLTEFLDMSEEELRQLSAKYQSLPPGRRGPDEITVAGPELAAAAAKAADEAAAAVVVASAGPPSPGGEHAVGVGAVGTVRDAADQAAARAAGIVLIPETPALASVLYAQLGVPKERVKRLLLKWPRLLEVSGYKVGQCVQWLTETLGMTKDQVAKLVLAHPPMFIKSVNFQLKPNLYWLENDLGLTRGEVRKVVCSCPQLLVKSVPSNFMPKICFFERRLGIGRDGIGPMLVRYPQLFNFSLKNMAWKARWLEEELLLDHIEVKKVFVRCPSVLAYSAERNLVPTLEFFLDELGATRQQVREAVTQQPRLLGMSLERRLRPRLQIIRQAGFTPSWELHHRVMLFASDVVFRRWLQEEPTGAAQRRRELQGGRSQTGRWRY